MRDVEFERLVLLALNAHIGCEYTTSDNNAFKRRFYALRSRARERGDSTFDALSCVTSPSGPDRIWLIKQSVLANGVSPSALQEEQAQGEQLLDSTITNLGASHAETQ